MATLANRLRLSSFSEMLNTSRHRRENFYGYLFLTPWLLGFLGLFLGPGLFSLYLSFTKYDVLSAPEWIGLDNYIKMFFDDPLFYTSLGRTFYYAGVGVPIGVIGSMFLAILLNAKLRGLAAYRTLFFMPSLVPIVASVVLWKWLLHADFGIINQWLVDLGWSDPPGWFGDRRWAIPSLIVMGLWQGLGRNAHDYLPRRPAGNPRVPLRSRLHRRRHAPAQTAPCDDPPVDPDHLLQHGARRHRRVASLHGSLRCHRGRPWLRNDLL